MKKVNKYILIMLLSGIQSLWAQTDTLERGRVEITRKYKPEIKKGDKFYSAPLPETAFVAPPVIDYKNIPAGTPLDLNPNLPVLKALALPAAKLKKLYGNMVKLGIGNYAAPFAELSLMNLRSKETSMGINLHHFSNNGNKLYKVWSENRADAYFKKYNSNYIWNTKISYDRDGRRFYSFEPTLDTIIDKSTLKIFQQVFDIHSSLSSNPMKKMKNELSYQTGVKYSYLNNQFKQKEQNFNIYGDVSMKIRGNLVHIKSDIDLNGFEGNYTYNRIFYKLNPTYQIKFKDITTTFGAKGVFLSTDNNSVVNNRFYFYPDLKATYTYDRFPMNVYASLTGDMNKSTRQSLYKENPFISQHIYLSNVQQNKLSYGVNARLGNKWFAEISGHNFFDTGMPIYYIAYDAAMKTDSLSSYSVVYKSINYQQYTAKVSYRDAKWFFQTTASFYQYKYNQDSLGLMRPMADIQMHLEYQIDSKIFIRTDIYTMSKRRVGFADENFSNFRPSEIIKGYTDFNLSVDYKYSDYVSAFFTFRNLSNSNYARWYNYPVNRINFLTGITLTF